MSNAKTIQSPYQVKISGELVEQVKSMVAREQKLFVDLLRNLSMNSHPMQAYKIHGMHGLYRILFEGNYLVYRVEEKSSEVLAISLAKP